MSEAEYWMITYTEKQYMVPPVTKTIHIAGSIANWFNRYKCHDSFICVVWSHKITPHEYSLLTKGPEDE